MIEGERIRNIELDDAHVVLELTAQGHNIRADVMQIGNAVWPDEVFHAARLNNRNGPAGRIQGRTVTECDYTVVF
jgi:hypothetical protein